jgi:hypothetical protein
MVLSIGVTGWSLVSTCAGVVPRAVEYDAESNEASQMSWKRESAQASYYGR